MRKLLFIWALLPLLLLAQDTWVNVEFEFDGYADEVTWNLSNSYGVIESGGDYAYGQLNAFHVIDSLYSGDYTFELLDAFGDGLSYPADGYCLVSNSCQDTLFYAVGNYGSSLIESLTIAPCAPPQPIVIDCMEENAINYNPDADVNDSGLCEYPSCEGWGEPFVDQECSGGSALLYYNWEVSDNPNCNVVEISYGSADGNYNFNTNIDNGLFGVYAGNGQMPPNWEEEYYFQVTFADSTLSDTILYTPYPCTQGCMDDEAENYNPWATVDDGTCGNQGCDEGLTSITIDITLDNWPSETGWSLVSGGNGGEITSGTYDYQDVGQTYSYNYCVMESGFEFIITDEYGDGLAGSTSGGTIDGDVIITGCNGDTITSLSSNTWLNASQDTVGVGFGNVAYSTWQEATVCAGPEEVLGCTDLSYQEFNPLANTDDGSCLNGHIFDCINPEAFNYNPDATQMEIYDNCNYTLIIEDDAGDGWGNSFLGVVQGDNQWSFTMGPGDYQQNFPIWLETDKPVKIYYFEVGDAQTPPEEVAFQTLHNSFRLINANDVLLVQGGTNPFANNGQGALQSFSPPLYNTYQALPFCGTLCIPTVEGCLDSEALNYDSEANTDDGSCVPFIYGCTNELAFNYDSSANTDDGSCIPEIVGCMDVIAWNYNDGANAEDGSCLYFGCTDSSAMNYNDIANVDNGSCLYPGCTDSAALNYNDTANTDDGSCIPIIFGCTNSEAFNYEATANTDNDSCIPVIEGCTNIFAFNYDVFANVDNGSCVLTVYGCTDATALNYNSSANIDNDTCIEIVSGCTDSTAINYNELANVDDFSCIDYIYGCTDPESFNYNVLANTDNDSCIPVILGCTDVNAFNYNANANTEDFSCIEFIYGCTDSEALNYDELANTENGSCIDVLTGCTDPNADNYNVYYNTDDGSCEYDAGCSGGAGEPYWLPNECFEWVISIDTECCSGDWDNYCVELYNYCDLGWPIDISELGAELLIYPNPTENILYFKGINIFQADIYDMTGQLVITKNDVNQIDMSNLATGIYNLSLTYKGNVINQRVIKK